MPRPLLDVDGVSVSYAARRRLFGGGTAFTAVERVDLSIAAGEAFAIVGESGAGKSSLSRCLAGVQRPTGGEIRFGGAPLQPWRDRAQRRAIQMVFQDPYSSLNPRRTVGSVLGELLRVHGLAAGGQEARERAGEALELVGLGASALDERPSAFSGGQRQRIGIARALVLEPRVLIADEPVSALDVSVQAAILLLLKRLQRELGLTIVFVSHDLAVVRQFCDRVAVMRDGRLVECAPTEELFERPREAYTRELIDAAADLPELEVPATVPAAR